MSQAQIELQKAEKELLADANENIANYDDETSCYANIQELYNAQNFGAKAFDTEAEALEHFEVKSFTDDVVDRFDDGSVLISWHQ